MALQIEPCPFCGGHHLHLVLHSLTYSVTCQTCRCRGPQHKIQEQAVMQWNETSRQQAASDKLLQPEGLGNLAQGCDLVKTKTAS